MMRMVDGLQVEYVMKCNVNEEEQCTVQKEGHEQLQHNVLT